MDMPENRGLFDVPGGIGMGALGDRPEATAEQKQQFTNQARGLFAQSRDLPPHMLPSIGSAVRAVLAQLGEVQPWRDQGGWFSDVEASDVVRAQLQQALKNVLVRTGQTDSSWSIETRPFEEVNVVTETGRNMPGEISKCLADPASCLPRFDCGSLPQPLRWVCENPGKTAGFAVGILAAPYVLPPLVGTIARSIRAVRS